MKRWILCFVTALAIGLIGSATASAQGYGWMGGGYGYGGLDCGYGGYGGGYGGGYSGLYSAGYGGYGGGYAGSFGYSGRGISLSVGFGRPGYLDRSYLHYHPGGIVRHRDHFHCVPGHYHLHHHGRGHH
jgi:hypothetical protein